MVCVLLWTWGNYLHAIHVWQKLLINSTACTMPHGNICFPYLLLYLYPQHIFHVKWMSKSIPMSFQCYHEYSACRLKPMGILSNYFYLATCWLVPEWKAICFLKCSSIEKGSHFCLVVQGRGWSEDDHQCCLLWWSFWLVCLCSSSQSYISLLLSSSSCMFRSVMSVSKAKKCNTLETRT